MKDERAIKLRVFDSRGEKCERCGYNKKEILNVHHKDRNHDNNDLANLELLCPNCHAEEHYFKDSWLSKIRKGAPNGKELVLKTSGPQALVGSSPTPSA